MTSITWGAAESLTPDLITGYEPDRQPRNIAHDILGEPPVAFTLRRASLRSGTLELFFKTHAAAAAAEAVHVPPRVFTITNPPLSGGMVLRYIVHGGNLSLRRGGDGLASWVLRVPFREVP